LPFSSQPEKDKKKNNKKKFYKISQQNMYQQGNYFVREVKNWETLTSSGRHMYDDLFFAATLSISGKIHQTGR
jgi:hypothetical protein